MALFLGSFLVSGVTQTTNSYILLVMWIQMLGLHFEFIFMNFIEMSGIAS